MNWLTIDAGNSRIKWGVADSSGWLRRGWVDSAAAGEREFAFTEALQDLPVTARIVISNVAGELVRAGLTQALAAHGVAPHGIYWVQGRAQQCGVKSGYADPTQLGADRWAGLIAAWHLFGRMERACVVVNAGTTMTVDALSDEGVFLGGVIVPGLDLMRASLARGTAQLKLQQGAFCYFPDNTADAMVSGALNAAAGAIDRMCRYLTESGQREPTVVLSGGAAALIQPRLNARVECVDNLVLEGLLEIAKEGDIINKG